MGVEFRSNGAYASSGFDEIGSCDDSGTWATADSVLTLTITAVSNGGADCDAVGTVETFAYVVDSTTLTMTDQSDGTVLVLTKM